MNTLEVYSPLQDLSIICGEHRELVYAINRSLELTENTASPSQKIRKVITIQKLVDDNKRMKKYEVDSKIPWNWGDVASALYSNFDIIRKLYEAQGWTLSTQCTTPYEFGAGPTDELIFEF